MLRRFEVTVVTVVEADCRHDAEDLIKRDFRLNDNADIEAVEVN